MRNGAIKKSKLIFFSLIISTSIIYETPAIANEVIFQGLHCNDFCQSWMGYDKKDTTGSVVERPEIKEKPPIYSKRPIAIKPVFKIFQPKVKATETARAAPIIGNPALEIPETVKAVRHLRPEPREVYAGVPLPIPRPAMPSSPPAAVADVPIPATPTPPKPPHKAVAATVAPDSGMMQAASVDQAPPPVPDRLAMLSTPELRKAPPRIVAPTTVVVPSPPSASSPSQVSNAVTAAPFNNLIKPSADATAALPTPADVGQREAPTARVATAPKPSAPQATTVVASLPFPMDAGIGGQNSDHPSENLQDGSLQPISELAGAPLPVTVGQISAEPSGTNVHVVVVNIRKQEMKSINVRCRARDTQGLQVAQAYTYISNIAPSDVFFGQVLFPAEITAQDNNFTCEVSRVSAPEEAKP